jgi:hypothetical protein
MIDPSMFPMIGHASNARAEGSASDEAQPIEAKAKRTRKEAF